MSLCLYIRDLKKNKKRMLIDVLLCSYMLVLSGCALLLKFSIGLDKLFKKLLIIKIRERERTSKRIFLLFCHLSFVNSFDSFA